MTPLAVLFALTGTSYLIQSPLVATGRSHWWNVTKYVYSSTLLVWRYFTWVGLLSASLYFHSNTFWRQILDVLLHYLYLITSATLQISCCIRAKVVHFRTNLCEPALREKKYIPVVRKKLNIWSDIDTIGTFITGKCILIFWLLLKHPTLRILNDRLPCYKQQNHSTWMT